MAILDADSKHRIICRTRPDSGFCPTERDGRISAFQAKINEWRTVTKRRPKRFSVRRERCGNEPVTEPIDTRLREFPDSRVANHKIVAARRHSAENRRTISSDRRPRVKHAKPTLDRTNRQRMWEHRVG